MSRTVAIKESIQTVKGYPKKLVIYFTPASKYYWTRVFYLGKYHTRTTKTTDPKHAKKIAIEFYQEVLLKVAQSGSQKQTTSLAAIAKQYLDSIKKSKRASAVRNDTSRFENGILPFFAEQDIRTINHSQLNKFVGYLAERELTPATQKHYLVVLSKIMKFAMANDLLDKFPLFPRVTGQLQTDQKRHDFSLEEYDLLVKTAEILTAQNTIVRGVQITLEMKYLIQFMVNSFIRPSDLRVIKHKHITKREEGGEKWITLTHPATKTNANEVQAMPATVGIYKNLCDVHKALKHPDGKDDYIFLPTYKNRSTAMGVIARLFRRILKETSIQENTGKNLTLYSLRHTAIMLRIVKGNVNTLALARNARTSQMIIDRFYAAHLTTDHVRKQLHAFIEKTPTKKTPAKKAAAKKRAVNEQQTVQVVEKPKIPKKSVSKAVSKTKAVKKK
jgi:site-specific recombinase XerD